jgi:hypothetical protein
MIKRYKGRELGHPTSLEVVSLIYENADFVLAADHEELLISVHKELTDHGHQELGECDCVLAREIKSTPQRGPIMGNPCMHYGIPCEVGTEGNCVCRQRFYATPPTHTVVESAISASKDPSAKWSESIARRGPDHD